MARKAKYIRTSIIGAIGILWGAFVLAILVWQLVAYRGLVERLIEWQFARFDVSFPILTIIALVLLVTSPFVLILLLRVRKARSNPKLRTPDAAIHRGKTMRLFLGLISATLAVCALFVATFALTIGGVRDTAQPLTLADLRNGTETEGRVQLGGTLQLDRIGFFEDRLLFSGRQLWVAPITGSGQRNAISLFVEVDERRAGPAERRSLTGVLRKAGAPGELRRLYENAGYSVDQPTYLLFKSGGSARAPYFGAALDLLIGALIFLIVFTFQHRRLRKLIKTRDEDAGYVNEQ